MQIEALIERLEGLSGPDREVDALAMQVAFPKWAKIGAPYLSPHCIGDEPIYWHAPQGSPYQKMPVPELTASLDATIELMEKVLPGWRISIHMSKDGHYAQVHTGTTILTGKSFSPEVALLIAMFRALAAGGPDA